MCSNLTKRVRMSQRKEEIFVELNRAGHGKSVIKVMANLRICFICRLKSYLHVLGNLMLKFSLKNCEIKLNYQILKVKISLEILAGLLSYLAHLHTTIFCIDIYNIFG